MKYKLYLRDIGKESKFIQYLIYLGDFVNTDE